MKPLRNLVGVVAVLQAKAWEDYILTIVTMRLYSEGFVLDYDFSLRDEHETLPDSFPEDSRSGTSLRLTIGAVDDTGLEYHPQYPPFTLNDDKKWFFVSTFYPGIADNATSMHFQITEVSYDLYQANGRLREKIPIAGVAFKFDVDLRQLIKFNQRT